MSETEIQRAPLQATALRRLNSDLGFSREFKYMHNVVRAEINSSITRSTADAKVMGTAWTPAPVSSGPKGRPKLKELAEELFDAKAGCKIAFSEFAFHLSREYRARAFAQLDRLMDVDEWEEGDAPISVGSYRTFLRTLIYLGPASNPGAGATSRGHFVASWVRGRNRLTLECEPNDVVTWIVSREIDGRVETAAGKTDAERLNTVLAPYKPQIWFDNGER